MEPRAGYAQVVVEIADRKVDRPFHYHIPSQLQEAVKPGVRVLVPFGHRQLEGYVIGLVDQAEVRSEEHTSELQSRENLVCRLLLEKKKERLSAFMLALK